MLKALNIKAVYNSEDDDLIQDFYIPVLSNAVKYDRAVGYFSANLLFHLSRGLSSFIQNNGKMRLIIGTALSPEETENILKGYEARNSKPLENVLTNLINEEMELNHDNEYFWKRLHCLKWLIEHGHLDIKVALRRNGIFHEKIGIVYDDQGDQLVFQGSANETLKALHSIYNFESINVFKAWMPNMEEHASPHVKKFERLWLNEERNTLVLDFPEAVKEHISSKIPHFNDPLVPTTDIEEWNKLVIGSIQRSDSKKPDLKEFLEPRTPEFLNGYRFILKDHQSNAIKCWRDNKFRGILELCTGAGKTITAIYALTRLYLSTSRRLFVVICVPYVNLAEQWIEVLQLFNIFPLHCYDSIDSWYPRLNDVVNSYNRGTSNFQCVVVVNKTMKTSNFNEVIARVEPTKFLWIGDEVHHHESDLAKSKLPENASLRLGLSATIQGCENIQEYYGKSVASFSLDDAIALDILCKYEYYPVVINLSVEETEAYVDLEKKIQPLMASYLNNPKSVDKTYLDIQLSKRANLLGNAKDKLRALLAIVDPSVVKKEKTLFYCSSTILNGEDCEVGADEINQIDSVIKILSQKGLKISRYTSRETPRDRKLILNSFKNSEVHCLAAIRCLDEGVDVPAVETAFLIASSNNPKQFIQRRGRVLRKSEGKQHAKIYDFVISFEPRTEADIPYLKKLLEGEMTRVSNFSSSSKNQSYAWSIVRNLISKYDIEF